LVSYAEWLYRHGCEQQAVLIEDTSWSCAHGIERWRSDCGCRIDALTESSQQWRAPLRDAIDWLVVRGVELTDEFAIEVLIDPWAARDSYVEVLIGSLPSGQFVHAHARVGREDAALAWVEAHRHLLMAQSSCAWFFDHANGHEVGIVLAQAQVAVELLGLLCGVALNDEWQTMLLAVTSLV
jgi:hypothetical protein